MYQISKTETQKKNGAEKSTQPASARFTVDRWSDLNALIMTLAAIATISTFQPQVLVAAAVVSFSALFFTTRSSDDLPYIKTSVANLLTAIRLILVLLVLSFFNELSLFTIAFLLTLSVCLDVLDGYVARKTCRSTRFGQYFDMESDAFFVLAMGVYFWFVTPYGLWLLLPGLLRYAYRLLLHVAPKSGFSEKKRGYAAFLAGTNFVLLLLAVPLTGWAQFGILILSTAIVCFSFALSFVEYALFKTCDKAGSVD